MTYFTEFRLRMKFSNKKLGELFVWNDCDEKRWLII